MASLFEAFFLCTYMLCCLSKAQKSLIGSLERKDSYTSDFRSNVKGVIFSAVFSDNAVLQREPHHAALYGTCDTFNALIVLTMSNMNNLSDIQSFSTISQTNNEWNFMLPQTYKNGGNYTLKVQCRNCTISNSEDTLYNITFGDIYFCAGQSNMALGTQNTFSANYTYTNITKLGKYSNIRFYTKHPLATSDNLNYVIPASPTHIDRYKWHYSYDILHLQEFSAVCWYFAQSLIDKYSMNDTQFGLISSAIGGSMIEVRSFFIFVKRAWLQHTNHE